MLIAPIALTYCAFSRQVYAIGLQKFSRISKRMKISFKITKTEIRIQKKNMSDSLETNFLLIGLYLIVNQVCHYWNLDMKSD